MRIVQTALLLSFCAGAAFGQQGSWITLFNGKDLTGWRANYYPDSFSVVDGTIRAHATAESSHLFYVGDLKEGFVKFKDFELELKAKGEPSSNSGVFIHTGFAATNAKHHLDKGYEIQLNSTEKEKRKTGSLYAIVDLPQSPVDETKWFDVKIIVIGQRIQVLLNGKTVTDYVEPAGVERPKERAGRLLDATGGAIALQGHDPGSTFYFKDIRIRRL